MHRFPVFDGGQLVIFGVWRFRVRHIGVDLMFNKECL